MKTTDQLYEELRAVIDNGNESMTHEDALDEDALDEVRALRALRAAKPPVRIIMDVRGGALQAVYGDRLPEGVQVEFILRDHDNIAAGDADPMNEDYAPDVYYW